MHGLVTRLTARLRLVRAMTSGAWALRRRRMADLFAVAARALGGHPRVVLVVTALAGVSTRRNDLRVLVAARAWLWREAVRRVTARAGVVTHRESARVDVQLAFLLGVTSLAACGGRVRA